MILVVILVVLLIGFVLDPSCRQDRTRKTKTNQEILEEYHSHGEFLGYRDGDQWARDVEKLHKAAEEVRRRGY